MANKDRLISASELAERVYGIAIYFVGLRNGKTLVKEAMEKYRDAVLRTICEAPTEDAIPVAEIEAYLQARLDEWNALGDRKWEPANMWGYNFIMACFDDLERRAEDG